MAANDNLLSRLILMYFDTGVQYKYDCPIEPKIPLFLIVFGAFWGFAKLEHDLQQWKEKIYR